MVFRWPQFLSYFIEIRKYWGYRAKPLVFTIQGSALHSMDANLPSLFSVLEHEYFFPKITIAVV